MFIFNYHELYKFLSILCKIVSSEHTRTKMFENKNNMASCNFFSKNYSRHFEIRCHTLENVYPSRFFI